MTRKAGILIGSTLTILCAIGCVVGFSLLVIAHRMPAHTDEARASDLTIQYETHYIESNLEEKASIERAIVSLRTSKWELYNTGIVLLLTTPILLAAIVRFKLWDMRLWRSVTTPRTTLRLLGLASAAWLGLLPAFLFELDDEYTQDDLIPTIDTGHGIEFVVLPSFFLTTWIVWMLIGHFTLRNARLPANLWTWDGDRPHRSLLWTVVYGFVGGAIAVWILFCWSARRFGWGLPSLIVGLYVIASTRAALVNGG